MPEPREPRAENRKLKGLLADLSLDKTILQETLRKKLVRPAAPTFRGADVARVLSQAGAARRLPARINVNNRTEITSKALDHWAYWHHV